MSVYGELDPMTEHRAQFAFKGKKEHIQDQHTKHSIAKPAYQY